MYIKQEQKSSLGFHNCSFPVVTSQRDSIVDSFDQTSVLLVLIIFRRCFLLRSLVLALYSSSFEGPSPAPPLSIFLVHKPCMSITDLELVLLEDVPT
jgi:hypothetical protein